MNRSYRVMIAALMASLASGAATQIIAQTPGSRELPYVVIQDSVAIVTVQDGEPFPGSWVAPSYEYLMTYDPASRTEFTFTECKKNGELLKLLSWNDNRVVHAPAELMSFNSRTANFQVHAGDTISFYREMLWYNPATSRQDTNNYYALDTLEMIVYLVSAGDGRPLAQLDSLGILPRITPGMPAIYGSRPLMALVSYAVPDALHGDSVLVGVTVRARGSGPYHFMRRDGVTIGLSERLKDPRFQEYLAALGPMYARRSIGELMEASGGEAAVLRVAAVPGSPRELRITFNGPGDGGQTALAVYDESGSLLFSPFSSRTGPAELQSTYRAPSGGAYFVTLSHNGRIVRTNKIIITH